MNSICVAFQRIKFGTLDGIYTGEFLLLIFVNFFY